MTVKGMKLIVAMAMGRKLSCNAKRNYYVLSHPDGSKNQIHEDLVKSLEKRGMLRNYDNEYYLSNISFDKVQDFFAKYKGCYYKNSPALKYLVMPEVE